MSVSLKPFLLAAGLLLIAPQVWAAGSGLGREATEAEIAGWDIDVRPDGQGLPQGSGDALGGEEIYLERCAACHGEFGEGAGRYPVLIGGDGTLASQDPVKTLGSYWPYASTLWDYINRAMPFGDAQSLSSDEVYAITAYLLNQNGIVEEDQRLDQDSLAQVAMPNRDGFLLPDPRPDVPVVVPGGEPCMKDCAGEPKIIGRATVIDVTPEGDASGSVD